MTVSRSRAAVQARAYYRRRRREGARTGLGRIPLTLEIPAGSAAIDTPGIFPEGLREAQVTFSWKFRVTSSTARGLMLEFGSSAVGCAAWVFDSASGDPADTVRMGVGAGWRPEAILAGGNDFTTATTVIPVNQDLLAAFAVRPGDGQIRLWINGKRRIARRAGSGEFRSNLGTVLWADDEIGTFFANATPPAGGSGGTSDPGPPAYTANRLDPPTGVHRTSPVTDVGADLVSLSPLRVHRCLAPFFGGGRQDPTGSGIGTVTP